MGRSTWLMRRRVSSPLPVPTMTHRTSPAVRIETERLILREFRTSDFDAYFRLSSDPETFRYSERGPMSGEETWTRLLRHVGHWALNAYGIFAVEERESGNFVGEAGLEDFRRELGPEFDGVPEASWSMAPGAQGRGYATEAAAAALSWLERKRGVKRTVCLIHRDNAASLKVATKLGYSVLSEISYRGYPALVHEREAATGSTHRQEP